jgi:hypothetical protein
MSRTYKAVQVTQPGKLEVAAEKTGWGTDTGTDT